MHVLALLRRLALVLRGEEDFLGELLGHRLALLGAGRGDHPGHREEVAALGARLARDLVVGAADAAGADLHLRGDVLEGEVEGLHRVLNLRLSLHDLERAVDELAGDRLLAALHQVVDELRELLGAVLRVGRNLGLLGEFVTHGITS